MRGLIRWYVILLQFLPIVQYARAENLHGKRLAEVLNIESGLSQSLVSALLVDEYGFLWIGTQDGLNRYDGYSFTNYRNNPLDSASLCSNSINKICEDTKGNLWIGTWRGLSYLDRATGKFINYYHNPSDTKTLSSNRIHNIYRDRQGVVWIKTPESLDRFNPESNTFDRFPHYYDPFTNAAYMDGYAIFEDSQSRFWVGTKDGLLLFDRNLGLFKRFSNDPSNSNSISSNNIRGIVEDEKGNIWIATNDGLNKLSNIKHGFRRYYSQSGVSNSLLSNEINALFIDSKGVLWIATNEGVSTYRESSGFSTVSKLALNPDALNTSITSIVEDSSRVIWMGTLSGLIKWDIKDQKFPLYSKDQEGNNLFGNNMIGSIYEDNGMLWVGTWNSGLYMLNRKTSSITKYSSRLNYPYKIASDNVHGIYALQGGEVLISTMEGVQVYNASTKSFSDFFKKKGVDASSLFKNNRVYSVLQDSKKVIWFGTSLGLYKFNGTAIEQYQHNPSDSTTLTSNEVYSMVQDADYLWLGTLTGLNRMDLSSGKVKRYTKSKTYTKGNLASNDIISLHIDAKENLWVGSSSGLHIYDRSKDSFKLITEEDGLPNNLIYNIEEDNNGQIWVSTNWGIAKINPSSFAITSYGVNDGLQSYEFNLGASYKSQQGELFFGGISGLNAFYPDSISQTHSIPPVSFTQLEIVSPTGRVIIPLETKNEVVVKHPFSMISFEFSVLDFTHPDRNRYMYKLEGFDEDWIAVGYKHYAVFSSIPEGKYTLRIKGANSDGVWNEAGKSIVVVIKTQWWRTRDAIFIYGILLVLFLVIIFRIRTKISRRTTKLLKELEITMGEMEDQREELLFKNKSITDSINYAKRIQEALIPSESHFKKILPESFILLMPKDIVSGDFYWINETENRIFVAAIDCTGHGVPGAFMSIIGVELLRNIISVMGINDPAEILNLLDKGVRDTFSKSINDEASNVKDGMDVSFCVIDKENRTLQFAGAFSNLYLIRDNRLKEIKGQHYTVGFSYELEKPQFFSHTESIQEGDMIYIFTDGYVDQFGGPEGKKFKFRRFRHLLLNIHKYPLEIQKKHLLGSINEWKGENEQVDDILIIGIKPDLA
ncbi:MAG: two-component regulator propeller domain-containing protein [Bacteroidales bacterium]|nr:two-component regulator propeller domain-containing protein [Bacteroidales bacterium]MDD4384839.1 two-component regulator propeller domain-containing protein [Bacteroidales bacterium]MDY0196697.1 two-component regulator propeller domain-containing protein [Tenuifilaceae bacterium]